MADEREEGRREILREIAKIGCIEYDGPCDDRFCFFCKSGLDDLGRNPDDQELHDPACLWVRAKAATSKMGRGEAG